MSIRARIIVSYLLIIGVGFFYLVKRIIDVKEIKPRYMESMEDALVDTAQLLASMVEGEVQSGHIDADRFREAFRRVETRSFVAQIYAKRKTTIDMGIYITDAQGIVVFDSDGGRAEGQDFSRWNDVYLTLRGGYGSRSTRSDPNDPTSSVIHVAAPIRRGQEIAGVLSISKTQQSMAMFMENTRHRIMWMGAIAAVVVVIVGSLLSGWLTRPIERLTRYAEAVRDGRRVTLPNLGRSEIAALGRTIEDMRDALEGRKYVENYVQTLTHEIKSPVSAIRGAAELLQEEMPPSERARFLHNIETETVRIQEIVDRLLLLSSTEAKKTLEVREPVRWPDLLRQTVSSVEAPAAARAIKLELEIDAAGDCTTEGDAFLLEKAVLNLLQNALAFAPDGGRIAIGLQRGEGRCRITVQDDGPGIPEYAEARVFDRFFSLPRPATGKKSSGLGLAFVREVAALHRGTATLENAPGGGAIAILEIPAV